jgi:glycosyltransferase involved in cell wall biosynthesis
MRSCLVVTTYERPDALARVLRSLATQTTWPDEVIVADDGSSLATQAVIDRFAAEAPRPVTHTWQPHEGFRAGRARNLAIARTTADYVLLLDGDMVMHPSFVADHLAAAREGCWVQGVRVVLDDAASRRLITADNLPGAWSAGIDLKRRPHALHAPRLSRLTARVANGFVAVKACNQGFWRRDLIAVNGFDEAIVGWGSEDKELCARLGNLGIQRRTLLFGGIACHLAHPPADRTAAAAHRDRWLETVHGGRVRCELGLDRHLPR